MKEIINPLQDPRRCKLVDYYDPDGGIKKAEFFYGIEPKVGDVTNEYGCYVYSVTELKPVDENFKGKLIEVIYRVPEIWETYGEGKDLIFVEGK